MLSADDYITTSACDSINADYGYLDKFPHYH